MKIEVYKAIRNPLPDFADEPILEGMYIVLNDEQIKKIGNRYFELIKGTEDDR